MSDISDRVQCGQRSDTKSSDSPQSGQTTGVEPSEASQPGQKTEAEPSDPPLLASKTVLLPTNYPDQKVPGATCSSDEYELLPPDPNNQNSAVRMYRFHGTVLTTYLVAPVSQRHRAAFRGRPTDVIVASFPKSGTTWLQELVWRVVSGEKGEQSGSGLPLEYRFPLLDCPPIKNIMEMADLHGMDEPRLIKTHLPYHLLPSSALTSGARLLYVSRDPRDVCVSLYHFSRMFNGYMYRGTFADFRDTFLRGDVLYGPYKDHVKGYLEHADTVLCVTYEQLHQDRADVIRRVAAFLGCVLTDEDVANIVRVTDFDVMKKNPGTNFRHWEKTGWVTKGQEGTFMRKGLSGDWRNYFTEEESEAFMKWWRESS